MLSICFVEKVITNSRIMDSATMRQITTMNYDASFSTRNTTNKIFRVLEIEGSSKFA